MAGDRGRRGGGGGGGGGEGALWKTHCQLLGRGDPVSKSHFDLSFLECCYEPSCERHADAILHKEFHQQFDLHSVVSIFQIDSHGQSLFLPLESFEDIVCESGCVFPIVFFPPLCALLGLGEVHFSCLYPGQASWPRFASLGSIPGFRRLKTTDR